MAISLEGTTILCPSGDTGVLSFPIQLEEDVSGNVLFTVKRSTVYKKPVIEKVVALSRESIDVSLSHEDTSLEPGDYLWDLRLEREDGGIDTLCEPYIFKVKKVVGNAGDRA